MQQGVGFQAAGHVGPGGGVQRFEPDPVARHGQEGLAEGVGGDEFAGFGQHALDVAAEGLGLKAVFQRDHGISVQAGEAGSIPFLHGPEYLFHCLAVVVSDISLPGFSGAASGQHEGRKQEEEEKPCSRKVHLNCLHSL
jgi:hypothetical protein